MMAQEDRLFAWWLRFCDETAASAAFASLMAASNTSCGDIRFLLIHLDVDGVALSVTFTTFLSLGDLTTSPISMLFLVHWRALLRRLGTFGFVFFVSTTSARPCLITWRTAAFLRLAVASSTLTSHVTWPWKRPCEDLHHTLAITACSWIDHW